MTRMPPLIPSSPLKRVRVHVGETFDVARLSCADYALHQLRPSGKILKTREYHHAPFHQEQIADGKGGSITVCVADVPKYPDHYRQAVEILEKWGMKVIPEEESAEQTTRRFVVTGPLVAVH